MTDLRKAAEKQKDVTVRDLNQCGITQEEARSLFVQYANRNFVSIEDYFRVIDFFSKEKNT